MGVLAEKGEEFMVELVAPCNTLVCNVLQICGWAGVAMDGLHGSHTAPELWDVWSVHTNAVALNLDTYSHTATPWICSLKRTD